MEIPDINVNNPQLAKSYEKIARLEEKKLSKFDEKAAKEDNKLKLLQDLKGRFSKIRETIVPFKTPADFRELKGFSSNEEVLKIGAIDKAVAKPGSYEVEVLNLANSNSIMTYGMPDRDKAEVGVGYISFKDYEGNSHEVYINHSNNTLDGVAQTINEANLGVKAIVVNDGTDAEHPWRIIMSGEGTGWKKDYEWPNFYFVGGDFDLDVDRIREAKSATIRFNGQPLMVDENSIKNLLPGVNIDLKNARPGEIIKLDVKPDFEAIQGKAKSFVDSTNAVLDFIQQQNKLTSDSAKDPTKALGGDVGLQSLESRLRTVIQQSNSELEGSKIQGIRDLGIVFNRQGTLDFDPKKFQKTLEDNFEEVSRLFAGDGAIGGFATEMIELVDGVTRGGDGMLSMRESNIKGRLKKMETDKERATALAETRLQRIRVQFGRADSAFEKMNQMKGTLPQGGPA
jgi:flagellar hook-associated protein 2